ncbi:MAG: YdcF family protein [Myxococcota bacterium]|nr:YdcF family protein [Myxococcota bacterium]
MTKWLAPLTTPLTWVFALGLFSLWRSRRSPAAPWLLATLALLWVHSAEIVVRPVIARIESTHLRTSAPQGDAIVVLGGYSAPALYPDSPPEFNTATDRIVEGIHLLARNAAPRLVLSGASSAVVQRDEPEARRIARWLESLGIERDRLVLESVSRSTAENATETARLAAGLGIEKVVLVTSALHMRRAVGCFEKAGLEVVPHPVDHIARRVGFGPRAVMPSEIWLLHARKLWKEILGSVWYALTGAV